MMASLTPPNIFLSNSQKNTFCDTFFLIELTKVGYQRGNDKKTGRREGIEPIKRVLTYVLFTVTCFL